MWNWKQLLYGYWLLCYLFPLLLLPVTGECFRKENIQLLLRKLCGCLKFEHFTLQQRNFLSQSFCTYLASLFKMTQEDTFDHHRYNICIFMCNGCLGITTGFDKGWHCSIWEKHKMYFLTQFFSCALDKIKKGKWAYDLSHTILGYIKGSVGPEDHGRWLLTWDPTWRSPLGDLTVALQYLKWGLQERWVGNLCQGV